MSKKSKKSMKIVSIEGIVTIGRLEEFQWNVTYDDIKILRKSVWVARNYIKTCNCAC